MRRALLSQLPALSATYGITPMDVDDMYPQEIAVYLAGLRNARTEGEE